MCSCTPAIFETNELLRKSNKSELAKAILSYVDGKSEIENRFDEQNVQKICFRWRLPAP